MEQLHISGKKMNTISQIVYSNGYCSSTVTQLNEVIKSKLQSKSVNYPDVQQHQIPVTL